MKRKLFFAAILILIIAGIVFFQRITVYFARDDAFLISDTASINRIEIIGTDSIVLNREGNSWTLNENQSASPVALDNLLFSFTRMGVKGSVNKPDISEAKSIRLKVFQGRRKHLMRLYNLDGMSFMHKEGARNLYAIEVSGFPEINLNEVINPDPEHWKDKVLLNLLPSEIRSVRVHHFDNPDKGFILNMENGEPLLFNAGGKMQISANKLDNEKISFYLSYFTNIFYDRTFKNEMDSALAPEWQLNVTDIRGKNYELLIYPIKSGYTTDMYKALVRFNNSGELLLTSYMVLDLVLQEKKHFLLE